MPRKPRGPQHHQRTKAPPPIPTTIPDSVVDPNAPAPVVQPEAKYFSWHPIMVDRAKLALLSPREQSEYRIREARLNSLGSLYYFTRCVLKKNRLTLPTGLHGQMCTSLERGDLHLVLEIPMGHFKTTIGSIALPMWWALPFTEADEYWMRKFGYADSWIRWMKLAHNPNTRTLITHEIEARAIAMGKEIDDHYTNNDLFRKTFPDCLPDNGCTWNDHSKFQKRFRGPAFSIDATTGTYEYRGVGQALQGIHPDSTIQDDNMGKEAQKNMLYGDGRVLDDLWRWHCQLTTRLDTFSAGIIGRQLVIGNRWGHDDLNSRISKYQSHFQFETHSAEGGCCSRHPANESIFPAEWPMARLTKMRQDLGNYDYAHMYLNRSVLPEECIFKPEWLRYFKYKESRPDLSKDDLRNFLLIEHQTVTEGTTIEDLNAGALHKRMIVDLAHAKKHKRCDHVILIIGYDSETERIYTLEVWAEPSPYSELVEMIYKIARRWGMRDMWLETVAAQNLLKFYLDERNRHEQRPLFVNELRYDNSENAKVNRITALEPAFKNSQVWIHPSQYKLINQYMSYPAGLKDILDTLGYAAETLENVRRRDVMEWISAQQQQFSERRVGSAGY